MPRQTKNAEESESKPKAKRKPIAGTREVVWGGFINIRMDGDSKLVFENWLENNKNEVWLHLDDALAEGLKYGVTWDEKGQCYITSFTGAGVSNDDARYCLTARAGNLDEATALLVFKHVVVCQCDWGNYRPSNSSVLNWG